MQTSISKAKQRSMSYLAPSCRQVPVPVQACLARYTTCCRFSLRKGTGAGYRWLEKLRRIFRYLRSTRELHLTLDAGEAMVAKWWVDASFAAQPDRRSHYGATFSLGKGAQCSRSIKQKMKELDGSGADCREWIYRVNHLDTELLRHAMVRIRQKIGPSGQPKSYYPRKYRLKIGK